MRLGTLLTSLLLAKHTFFFAISFDVLLIGAKEKQGVKFDYA